MPASCSWVEDRSFETSFCARATITPPTKHIGRLRNSAMVAAPKAWTMRIESTLTSTCCWVEANRIPEAEAKIEPMTHAVRRTLVGDSPVMSRSCGSSTTPRIAVPRRV
jgi:hypothetical protein